MYLRTSFWNLSIEGAKLKVGMLQYIEGAVVTPTPNPETKFLQGELIQFCRADKEIKYISKGN